MRSLRGGTGTLLATVVAALASACGSEPVAPPLPPEPVPSAADLLSGDGQVGLVGVRLAEDVVLRVLDQNGVPMAGLVVSATASGGGSVRLDRSTTDSEGSVRAMWTLGDVEGEQTLQFVVLRLPGVVQARAQGMRMEAVDVVRLTTPPAGDVGALATGVTPFGEVRDYRVLGRSEELALGDFRGPTALGRSEVALFSRQRRPVLVRDAWTEEPDVHETDLAEPVGLPLTIWIAHGPFEATSDKANADLDYARGVFLAEGLGVAFEDVEVVDVTDTENIELLLDFTCDERAAVEAAFGHHDDRLNVYYVRMVDGSTSRGQSCIVGQNFVTMASGAFMDLLSHEIGHMFGLFHVDGQATFGQSNVMHSASIVRAFLTEGQVFRAHWNANSSIGALGFTPEADLRFCGGQYQGDTCPTVDTRLFSDGGVVATAAGASGWVTGASGWAPAALPEGLTNRLTDVDFALLDRCDTGDTDAPLRSGLDARHLERVFSTGPSGALRDALATLPEGVYADRARSVREEALRLMVLGGHARAGTLLDAAIREDPVGFGPVVRWGRSVLVGAAPGG